jgi:hypothetical protein
MNNFIKFSTPFPRSALSQRGPVSKGVFRKTAHTTRPPVLQFLRSRALNLMK